MIDPSFLAIAMLPVGLILTATATASTTTESSLAPPPPISTLMEYAQNIANMADEPRTVAALKELRDYAGNVYYVCELEPSGYIIADASYGTILEYSPSAPSPYLGVEEDLVYLGPTYCFVQQNACELEDLFSGEILAANDEEFVRSAQEVSRQIHAELSVQAKQATPVSGAKDLEAIPPESFIGTQFFPKAGASTVSYHYIPGGRPLKNLITTEQIGYTTYNGNGICGYIAAGLLLYWIDEFWGEDAVINDFAFLRENKQGFRGPGLTLELRSYGSMNGTAALDIPFKAEDISDVLDDYTAAHSFTIDYNTDWDPLFSGFTDVMKWLKKKERPVLLFGRLHDPRPNKEKTYHTVLAYGWTENGSGEYQEIIAHYGWANYAEVVVQKSTSYFGSSLKLESVTEKQVPMTDVTENNSYSWAYEAAQYCGRYQILPVTDKKLNPSKVVTRGEFVQALYTLTGKPELSQAASTTLKDYKDITIVSPYYIASAWAVENQIMAGTSSSTLSLSKPLNRSQAAVLFMKYAIALGLSFASTSGPAASSFSDFNNVPSWARDGMDFCTKRYLITGVSDSELAPKDDLTRIQIAVVLYAISQKASRG